MRTIELYRKHKAGEVSREKFLYEVRRDKNLPWVTNVTSYDDAVKILKNKGIISEAEISKANEAAGDVDTEATYDITLKNGEVIKNVKALKNGKDWELETPTSYRQGQWSDVKSFKKNEPISELFGFSKAEKQAKASRENLETAKKEIDSKFDPIKLFFEPGAQTDNSGIKKVMENRLRDLGNDLPTVKELLPSLFTLEADSQSGAIDANLDYNGRILKGVIPSTFYFVLGPGDKVLDKSEAKEKLKNQLENNLKESTSLNEVDNNIPTDPAVDRVNPYFLKKGVEMLLAKEKELTNDSYIKALNKAASMLEKNPHAFDEEMFANAKDVEKADAKLETEEVKKANHKNKANEMKKVKVKSLKESAIEELTTHLKKKELVNEDSHWKHNIGSEVHTPDGPGKVIEIVGGTFTVEMEDGTHKDFQFNTVDHFTQKAAEEEPSQGAQDEPSLAGMWKKWDQDVASGKYPDMNQQYGQELRYKPEDIQTLLAKLKEYISKNKDDKEKMGKLKEAVKKLKENISDEEIANAKKTGEVVNVPSSNQQDIQKLKNKKVAYSTYQG